MTRMPKNKQPKTLIVNVSYRTTQTDLDNCFGKIGNTISRVACRRENRHPTEKWRATAGYAFVRFDDHETAVKTLEALGKFSIHGEFLSGGWAKSELHQTKAERGPGSKRCERRNAPASRKGSVLSQGSTDVPADCESSTDSDVEELPAVEEKEAKDSDVETGVPSETENNEEEESEDGESIESTYDDYKVCDISRNLVVLCEETAGSQQAPAPQEEGTVHLETEIATSAGQQLKAVPCWIYHPVILGNGSVVYTVVGRSCLYQEA